MINFHVPLISKLYEIFIKTLEAKYLECIAIFCFCFLSGWNNKKSAEAEQQTCEIINDHVELSCVPMISRSTWMTSTEVLWTRELPTNPSQLTLSTQPVMSRQRRFLSRPRKSLTECAPPRQYLRFKLPGWRQYFIIFGRKSFRLSRSDSRRLFLLIASICLAFCFPYSGETRGNGAGCWIINLRHAIREQKIFSEKPRLMIGERLRLHHRIN